MLFILLSVSIRVFFSPNGGAREAIKREIAGADSEISVAMYILTDRELSSELTSASERGVSVKVVMDGSQVDEVYYSKHRFLHSKGISIRIDRTHIGREDKYEGIMHHKFCIIDGSILISGSYNWTHSAEKLNDENIIIIEGEGSEEVISKFADEFSKLWERSISYSPEPISVLDAHDIDELRNHIGKWVTIVGGPDNWNISRSGHLFLDFTDHSGEFTFLMWKDGVDILRERGFKFNLIENSVVEMKGRLIDHEKYGLEIVTDNPDALKIR